MNIKIENLTNDLKQNISTRIIQLIKGAESIKLASAFITEDGLALIEKSLKKALEQKASVKILVGDMGGVTTPMALRRLLEIQNKWPKNFSARFIMHTRFHLKTFLFCSNNTLNAIVGSANLTGPGLEGDGEQAVLLTLSKNAEAGQEIIGPFDEYWDDDTLSEEINSKVIDDYQKTWKPGYNIEKRSAKRRKTIISKLNPLDKKIKHHYFHVPNRFSAKENKVIGDRTGWESRGLTWLGWSRKKQISRRDLMIVDDGDNCLIARIYAYKDNLENLPFIIAYRELNNYQSLKPSEVVQKLKKKDFNIKLKTLRSNSSIGKKLFYSIESILKNNK